MRRRVLLLLVLGLAVSTVPAQSGCGGGGSDCAKPGESCMVQSCCPKPDGSISVRRTFEYPGGVQTVTSCTCL
jgi:hypothetical protein